MALTGSKTPVCRRVAGRLGLAAATVLALVGCGSRAGDPGLDIARGVLAQVRGGDEGAAPPVDPRAVLNRAIINEAGVPLILVENVTTGTASTLARVAVNGPNETWQVADDVTVTLSREGVLRATRGFGDDLMAADIEATRRALSGGQTGSTPRMHVYLTANVGEDRQGFSCAVERGGRETVTIFSVTRTLTRLNETCTPQSSAGEPFTNTYWVDGSGTAWASIQYLSDGVGSVRIEYLLRD